MVELPPRANVVIIGGGVMGVSAAFHLAEAGVTDVLLLERGQLGEGSTSKAAGGVRAQFSDPVNIALGARSLAAFEDFERRPGQVIDLHQTGYLFLLTTPEQVATYEESAALQREFGIDTQILTAAEAKALSPAIREEDVLAASYHARDGYCSPESVVLGYATAARSLGATIRTNVNVTAIRSEGQQIVGVETESGFVECSTVICAAGAWSRDIAATVGVNLPVEPLRRQILVTEPLPAGLDAMFPTDMAFTIDSATTFYFHREGPGILLGMSYDRETPGFKLDMDDSWLPQLTAAIENRAPALLEIGIAHGWAGLYEDTPDHNALIGETTDVSRFLYATGFSGHGFLQGPAVGEVLRDLYLGREPVIDVSPLSADRFAFGGARAEANIV